MAQAFKLAVQPDPRLDGDGKLAFILQRQLRGYKSTNPGEKPQVALTGSILRKFYQLAISSFDKALCQLFIGAFFFAMCSCEYVKVQGTQKTKLLTVQNIRFFIGNCQIKHSDPSLSSADCVSITFERVIKNDVITQYRSGDRILCPVKVWAAIIRRISSYPGSSASDSVNLFHFTDGKKHFFTGTELLKRICQAATTLGPDSLGFTAKEIGLHSAHSGAAMAM
jgi:predicted nucleic-acid-binding Zn-ribbon protein